MTAMETHTPATATFTNETSSGWQTVTFSSPVSIQVNTTYTAAYWSSSGFAYDAGYFTNGRVSSPPLDAPQSTANAPNGVYAYGAGPQFPTFSYGNANYWVDVVYASGGGSSSCTQNCSIWPWNPTPGAPWLNSTPATLGLKFTNSTSGNATGVRFYQAAGISGTTIIGLLYSYNNATNTGTLLGSTAEFTVPASYTAGWTTLNLMNFATIQANTTYVAAYWSSSGFPYNPGYFTSSGVSTPPLDALQAGVNGPNGVYSYGATPQFPTFNYGNANY